MSSPATQIAAVIPASGGKDVSDVKISCTHPVPVPGVGEVLVKLDFSGVCHSDVHSIRGDTPMKTDVAGHEGVGKVVAVGSDLDKSQWMGQAVGIRYVWNMRFRNLPPVGLEFLLMSPLPYFRWLYSSCLECEICEVNHTACPNQRNAGANVPGTFQQYIVTPAIHATKIPSGLSLDSAAPLLCAGIAMYSSIKKVRARQGNWLAILGAGGGLGHMGIQIAAKQGLRVLAIDTGDKKRDLCLSLGATEFLDFRKVDIVEAAKMITSGLGVHGVICTANGEAAYQQSMQMLRPLGTLVCVGIPHVPFRVPATPFEMIVKGLTIVGNSAGTAEEMDELLAMAVNGDVIAHIEVFDLEEIVDVLQRLERSEIEGRAVLRIP
ncbi:Alcohol dehydrogenase 1 [Penicillium verhagenii]|uniref:Alcohol dehydrogenase 1 n=1 Tax=Penicillium verhagenii TaxID=1562060 RepID=UPI002545A5DE|nr:Alcohol dehydrogenase 1 [Penicillium verhagenii]KAJ5924057.1 Alcohol dehydrogenase 1 [Penicillium verhagenii]